MHGLYRVLLTAALLLGWMAPAQADLFEATAKRYGSGDKLREFSAALNANLGQVKAQREGDLMTPLHVAAQKGDSDVTTLLIHAGADVNALDAAGKSPIFYAVARRDRLMMQEFLLAGAEPNIVAKDGTTPLSIAVKLNLQESTVILIWVGASVRLPNAVDIFSFPNVQQNPMLQQLLRSVPDPSNPSGIGVQVPLPPPPTRNGSPRVVPGFVKDQFQEAARKSDLEALETLINQGIDINSPDSKGVTALVRAIRSGNMDVVYYLLMSGASPMALTDKKSTPFMAMDGWFGYGFDHIRRCLVLLGAKFDYKKPDGYTEMAMAAQIGNCHSLNLLMCLGGDPNEHSAVGTPLEHAYLTGHQPAINTLRAWGVKDAFPTKTDPAWTLANAAKRGDQAMVEAMLNGGLAVDLPDADGVSPLMNAIGKGELKLANYLIARGANINYVNPKSGMTPLFCTTWLDFGAMTEMRLKLIKTGAKVNVVNLKGETPLMCVLWHEVTTPLKNFVENGADINAKDAKGRTVLRIALDDGKLTVADYLRGLGAREQ